MTNYVTTGALIDSRDRPRIATRHPKFEVFRPYWVTDKDGMRRMKWEIRLLRWKIENGQVVPTKEEVAS